MNQRFEELVAKKAGKLLESLSKREYGDAMLEVSLRISWLKSKSRKLTHDRFNVRSTTMYVYSRNMCSGC